MQRIVSALCAVLVLIAYSSPAIVAEPSVTSPSPERNLLAAMRLWGDIKFFDPALVGSGIDWDAAFLSSEPAIAAAANKAQYAAAIATMLAPLHDPATHVMEGTDAISTGRIVASTVAAATLITVPHDVTGDESVIASDASSVVAKAAKTAIVAIDLRGVTESLANDAVALNSLFSTESPLLALVDGSISLPRERARAYLGYPGQGQGEYSGYFAQDSVADTQTVTGTSQVRHRFVFLVDGNTALPSMVLGLAAAGQAVIYSTGGNPSILAPSTAEMDLSYGVRASFRIGDLSDIRQPLEFPQASDPAQAIAKSGSSGRVSISRPPIEANGAPPPKDNPYSADAFPDRPKRMLAIARIYNVIRYFSPYTGLMHDNWDAAAIRAISDETAASDARSYLLGLMRFYAHLHDSHGYVGGSLVQSNFGAGVPFWTRYLHKKVIVTNVQSGSPAGTTLRVGDVIDSVNGVNVRRAMDAAEECISASTPQAANAAALLPARQYSIFSGKTGAHSLLSWSIRCAAWSSCTTPRRRYDSMKCKPSNTALFPDLRTPSASCSASFVERSEHFGSLRSRATPASVPFRKKRRRLLA